MKGVPKKSVWRFRPPPDLPLAFSATHHRRAGVCRAYSDDLAAAGFLRRTGGGRGFLIDRSKRGQLSHDPTGFALPLCYHTLRLWRSATLWEYLHRPWAHVSVLCGRADADPGGAESIPFVILVLGFFQTIAPLKRPPLLDARES